MIRSFGQHQYVPHARVWDMFPLGWMIVDTQEDWFAGNYSVRMWRCDCFGGAP